MRFRAEQHLRRASDIRAVREQGRRIDCRAFTLWWVQPEDPETTARGSVAPADSGSGGIVPPIAAPVAESRAGATPQKIPAGAAPKANAATYARVCVIASSAAVGNAARRNRAKRRLREVFRRQQGVLPAQVDLLLIARQAATDWPLPELERRFLEACRRIAAEARMAGS